MADGAPHPLIGTWAFVASEWKRADGRHANPFGEGSVGILIYGDSGYMSVQIMRADRPAVPPGTAATLDTAFASAVPGFFAYFASYEIDDAAGTIAHTVLGSSSPPLVGATPRRRFEINGDTLTLRDDLTASDGVPVAAATVWRRV